MRAIEYTTANGNSPFGRWFGELDPMAAAKIVVAVARLSAGNTSNVKGVGEGVLEQKVNFGPGYRVYFGRDGDKLIILLGGGTKRRQQETSRMQSPAGTIIAQERRVEAEMPLTREFKDTVKARADVDAAFRAALLSEVVDLFLAGDMATGKSVLRDYINATIGFAELAAATGVPEKSLMRMVSASGNPRADNLFAIIGALQQATGVQLSVQAAA